MPAGKEVTDGTAVGGDQSVEAPFVAQNLLFIASLCATGLTVDTLVGAHDLCHLALLHQCLESREIGFPEVALWQILDIKLMAVPLRTTMDGEMLGASEEFFIFRRTLITRSICRT